MISGFIVLRNGLPIVSVALDPTKNFKLTEDTNTFTLVSGFFQAINSFADSVENLGHIDEVQMTDLLFTFQRKSVSEKDKELLFVLTTEGCTDKSLRKIIIEEASSRFLYMFEENLAKDWNGDIKPYHAFEKTFVEIVENQLKNHGRERQEAAEMSSELGDTTMPEELPKYQMPEIATSVTLNPLTSEITPGKSGPEPPYAPDSDNRKRLQDYYLLQEAQGRLDQLGSQNMSARMFSAGPQPSSLSQSIGALSKFAAPEQGLDNSLRSLSPPNHPGHSNFPTAPGAFPDPSGMHTPFPPAFSAPMAYSNRKMLTTAADYAPADYFRRPVQDLIPSKRRITAGVFRNQIEDSWVKVLMVAIDGRKSLKTLAHLLDMPLPNVIQACEYLEKRDYITFR